MSASSNRKKTLKINCLRLIARMVGKSELAPSAIDSEKIQRILLIAPQRDLKDLLLSIPVLRAVRQKYLGAHISVLARSDIAPVLLHNVYLDEVLDGVSGWTGPNAFVALKKTRSSFDLVIVLNVSSHPFAADFLAHFSKARYVLGSEHMVFDGCRENFFYDLRAPYAAISEHQVERYLDIVRHLGMDTTDFSEAIFLTQEEKNRAVEFLNDQKVVPRDFLIAIHLGSDLGEEILDSSHYVDIAKFFSTKYNAKIIVFWSAGSQEIANGFLNGLPFKPVEINTLSLRDRAAVLFFCNIMLCEHSNSTHLAASLGIPVIGLFEKLDPHHWKPIGKQIIAIKGTKGLARKTIAQVKEKAKELLEFYPKASRLRFDNLEISDSAVKPFLNIFDQQGGRL